MDLYTVFWIGFLAFSGITLGAAGLASLSDTSGGKPIRGLQTPKSPAICITFLLSGLLLLAFLGFQAL